MSEKRRHNQVIPRKDYVNVLKDPATMENIRLLPAEAQNYLGGLQTMLVSGFSFYNFPIEDGLLQICQKTRGEIDLLQTWYYDLRQDSYKYFEASYEGHGKQCILEVRTFGDLLETLTDLCASSGAQE